MTRRLQLSTVQPETKTRSDQRKIEQIARALRHSPVTRDPARLLDVLRRCGIALAAQAGKIVVTEADDGLDREAILVVLDAWMADSQNVRRAHAVLRLEEARPAGSA